MTNYECLCGSEFAVDSEESRVWELCPDCGTSVKANLGLGIYTFCKGREWVYDKRKNVPNQGRHLRSDQAQHNLYKQMVGAAQKRGRQEDRSLSRKDDAEFRLIGRTPLEAHESVVEQMGDKEFFQKAAQSGELPDVLKRMGCYTGDD